MKITFIALASAFLISGVAIAKETTTTLKVTGWHCEGCSGKTIAAVKAVKGVKEATADLEAKKLTVTYDDEQAKPTDIEAAVKHLHYKVTPL